MEGVATMTAFFEYIGNITYYLIFASVAGMFAPVGKYKKFVSLVLGFVLLLLIVQPLAGFFGQDIPVQEWFADAIPINFPVTQNGTAIYEQWWDEHLRGSFEAQLEAQVTRLLNANNFAVNAAEFSYSADFSNLTEVRVSVTPHYFPRGEGGRVPFIRIQPPQISPIRIGETPTPETCPYSETVKNLISQFYNLPTSHIYVEVTKAR
jgi:hypothetical protein